MKNKEEYLNQINKLKKAIAILCEINKEEYRDFHYHHMTSERLIQEARMVFRATKFGNSFDEVNQKVKLYNIIFLKKYDVQI